MKLEKKEKKFYTSYSKLSEVKLITIGLASPERIKQWAEKTLPNGKILGEVINANTLHHKTFKPQKGGLFCERIFGPLKDFECSCGKPLKYKKEVTVSSLLSSPAALNQIKPIGQIATQVVSGLVPGLDYATLKEINITSTEQNPNKSISGEIVTKTRNFCNTCEVEYTWSVMRRYQLGYIRLISPVTHVWYLKGNPSYLSILLDIKKRHLEHITYCSETITLENALKGGTTSSKSSDIVSSWKKLKEQIILEKATNLIETNYIKPNIDLIQNKIEKREKLKLKKYKYWKIFYLFNTHSYRMDGWDTKENETQININEYKRGFIVTKDIKENTKNGYNFLVGNTPRGMSLMSYRRGRALPALSEMKTYTNKINLKKLKFLSFLITQTKKESNTNVKKIKQIFKKISIPFYILLNLNVFSQKSIFNNVITTTWKKIAEKALKKALIRVNKIYNKIDYTSFNNSKDKNFSNSNIETLKATMLSFCYDSLFLNLTLEKESLTDIARKKEIGSKDKNFSLRLAFDEQNYIKEYQCSPSGMSPRDCIKSIKNNFYSLFSADYYKMDLLKNSPSGLGVVDKTLKTFPAPKALFIKSHFYLEFYTLSNFPSQLSEWIISDFLKKSALNITIGSTCPKNSVQSGYQKLKKNLSDIFFNIFFKNLGPDLGKMVNAKFNLKHFLKPFKIAELFYPYPPSGKAFPDPSYSSLQGGAGPKEGPLTKKLLPTNSSHRAKSLSPEETGSRSIYTQKNSPSGMPPGVVAKTPMNKKDLKDFKNYLLSFYHGINEPAFPPLYLKGYRRVRALTPRLHSHPHPHPQPPKGGSGGISSSEGRGEAKDIPRFLRLCGREMSYRETCRANTILSRGFSRKSKTAPQGGALFPAKARPRPLGRERVLAGAVFEPEIKWETARGQQETKWETNTVGGVYGGQKPTVLDWPRGKVNYGAAGMSKKKLYNNIYCLSHRERWEVENDWNFLYYFVTAPSENEEKMIPNYKDRYENGYLINLSAQDYNPTLTYQNISFNLEKSAFFSGPGIVQQLLNEFNFNELRTMDKQNRFLHYLLNKKIVKLKKQPGNQGGPFNTTASNQRQVQIGSEDTGPTHLDSLEEKPQKTGLSSRKDHKPYRVKEKELKELKELYKKRDLLIRRTKLVRKFFRKESPPQATILTMLPVLPPDLRPIVKMGDQIAASDLNRLYQRVIYRNDRLKKFLKDPATSHSYEMKYAQRLLQEAVDNLIQNGKSGVVSEKDSRGRALKSLSDILKGKQGRFRQYLLGKRVDYSGRSVIVVGPKLNLHECGIPKEMALELYLPFLLRRILNENLARTVVGAKTLIKTNPSLIWELLREIMQTCPVLLNRAPTLHRLGIQAFQPKLIDGRAILLHPLVCSAFNADFDGDQMAVHVPITVEARAEAWKLMLSRNNILSPATGDPLAIPSQDMVLGCYYLTTNLLNSLAPVRGEDKNFLNIKGSGFYFSHIEDVLKDYQLTKIDLHANIWLKLAGNGEVVIENGSDQEEPIEIRIDSFGNWKEIYNKSQKGYDSKNSCNAHYILTTPGKILFNQIIQKSLN